MIFFYLLLGIIICWRLKFFASGFDADYISRERTTAINGVFIVMVLLSHAIQSLDAVGYPFNAFGDDVVLSIRSAHLQLIVVTFLFYSGFGVMEQFKKKGLQYLKFMPRRRIWATYVNYLVSAIVLTVVMVCVTKKFDATFIFARLLALDTWYIFAILFCYIAFWLAYSIKQGGGQESCLCSFLCTLR